MSKGQFGWIIAIILIAAASSACAPLNATPGSTLASATSTPVTTIVPSVTPVPTLPPAITPPNSTPTKIVINPDGFKSNAITLDNNNQLFTLHAGETLLLKLGENYQWEVLIDNPKIISRVPNIAVIRGAQGVYQAHLAGTTTLTANGDPACRQSQPACAMPSIQFTLHIEVMP